VKPILSILALLFTASIATAQPKPIPVSVSFSILEDFAAQVGGNRITVTSLVPRDGDAHDFQPSAQDAKKLAQASVIFVNGLGFESWFEKLASNAGGKARVVTLSDGLKPRKLEEAHAGEAEHAGEEEHGEFDPHLWWNPMNAVAYVKRIGATLTNLDSSGKGLYDANVSRYARELADIDAWAKSQIARIPVRNRKIVTNHDALGYFADRYGLTVVGTVIPGGGTGRAPSAKEIAELVRVVRRAQVKAIFTENVVNPKLAQTVAQETGAKIAPALYTDALSAKGSSGDTYLKAFRHNVTTIVNALK
jgi:zinc/manganese transport system substrate-binding protein